MGWVAIKWDVMEWDEMGWINALKDAGWNQEGFSQSSPANPPL